MHLSMGIRLVAKKKECSGSEKNGGDYYSVKECGDACKDISTLFAFGRTDSDRCDQDNEKCRCYCETAATKEGYCNQKSNGGYNLYGYTDPIGKYVVLKNYFFRIMIIMIVV